MAFSSLRKTSSRAQICERYSSASPESTRCVLVMSTACCCLSLPIYLHCIYLPLLPPLLLPSPLPSSLLLFPSSSFPPPPPPHISSVHLHSHSPPRPACLKQLSSHQLTPCSSNKTRIMRELIVTQMTQCMTLRENYHSLPWAVVVTET